MENEKVTRRDFLGISSAAALGGVLPQPAKAHLTEAEPEQQPGEKSGVPPERVQNLILFMPDELRADALACYGNPLTKTPNFDHLAKEGARFANCHVQYPICGASRCSMLTGWPVSVRGHRSQSYFLRPNEPNLFRYLRQAGYDVFWYGKNDALAAESFYDSVTEWNFSGGREIGGGKQGNPAAQAKQSSKIHPTDFIGHEGPDPRQTAEYARIQAAIQILKRKESDKPFCIFLPLISPHPPYGAPQGFYDMYHPADITGLSPIGLQGKPDYYAAIRKAYGLDTLPEDTFRAIRALYYGSVSYSDWLLGQLLEAIEASGHSQNTAVMVFADHGDYAGDYGLVEKWPSGLEDALTHVPLIAYLPGQNGNKTIQDPVMLFDVMATCLDLAATKADHTHFARSLVPYLRGDSINPRTAVFAEGGYNTYEPQCFEYPPPPGDLYHARLHLQVEQPQTVSRAAMVRTLKHKLVIRPDGQNELYSYQDDPHELHNRYGETTFTSVQSELQSSLLDWYIRTTGIAPYDKDQRDFPPYTPTPVLATSQRERDR